MPPDTTTTTVYLWECSMNLMHVMTDYNIDFTRSPGRNRRRVAYTKFHILMFVIILKYKEKNTFPFHSYYCKGILIPVVIWKRSVTIRIFCLYLKFLSYFVPQNDEEDTPSMPRSLMLFILNIRMIFLQRFYFCFPFTESRNTVGRCQSRRQRGNVRYIIFNSRLTDV